MVVRQRLALLNFRVPVLDNVRYAVLQALEVELRFSLANLFDVGDRAVDFAIKDRVDFFQASAFGFDPVDCDEHDDDDIPSPVDHIHFPSNVVDSNRHHIDEKYPETMSV